MLRKRGLIAWLVRVMGRFGKEKNEKKDGLHFSYIQFTGVFRDDRLKKEIPQRNVAILVGVLIYLKNN